MPKGPNRLWYWLYIHYRNWRYNEFNAPGIPWGMFRNFKETEFSYSLEVFTKGMWVVFTSRDTHYWEDSEGKPIIHATDIRCLIHALKYHKVWIPLKEEK